MSAPETEPICPTVTVEALPPDSFVFGHAHDVWIRYNLTVVQPKATFTTLLEHFIIVCLTSIGGSASSLKASNWHLHWSWSCIHTLPGLSTPAIVLAGIRNDKTFEL